MHPIRARQLKNLAPIQANLQVQPNHIREQIKSFAKGSSAGPDLLSPQHIQDLTANVEESYEFVQALTDLVNLLLSGNCPQPIASLLCGAKLIALKKPNNKIRPIAIGCSYRRIAAKCANLISINMLKIKFGSLQIGVGCKLGAEAAIHAARKVASDLKNDECLIKIDISNAFNSICRDQILEAVYENVPQIFNFCRLCYDNTSTLWFNGEEINSSEGVQQGDPLGCTLFALTLHPTIESLQSGFKVGYVDDITICDKLDIVEKDIVNFETNISLLGLQLNRSKCEILGNHGNSVVFEDFIKVTLDNCELLGAPLVKGTKLDHILNTKIVELSRIGERINLISRHDALVILKNVLSLPKLNYILRCSPCYGNSLLLEFDQVLKKTVSLALNIHLDETAWTQACLPVKFGGIGIRSTCDLASSSFLASTHASSELSIKIYQKLNFHTLYYEAFNFWNTKYPIMSFPVDPTKQKNWDQPCIKDKIEFLTQTADSLSDKARLLALRSPKSGAWLDAWPLTSCGLRLTDEEVRISTGLRLGAAICTPHDCKLCGAPVDSKGTHGLSCKKSAGRHIRHTLINDIIARSLAKLNIPTMREPKLSFEDSSRVDGCTLIPWQNGKALAWDATIADTLAPSYLTFTSFTAGSAADRAATQKHNKYASLPQNYIFIPVALETLGPINIESYSFLKNIAHKLAHTKSDAREIGFFFQRISMAIQKGNAISVLGSTSGYFRDDFLHS